MNSIKSLNNKKNIYSKREKIKDTKFKDLIYDESKDMFYQGDKSNEFSKLTEEQKNYYKDQIIKNN